MNKVYSNAASALAGVMKDGMIVMSGGFGLCGIPETLIEAVRQTGVKELTLEVDFGKGGPVQDHVDWADARLVK